MCHWAPWSLAVQALSALCVSRGTGDSVLPPLLLDGLHIDVRVVLGLTVPNSALAFGLTSPSPFQVEGVIPRVSMIK